MPRRIVNAPPVVTRKPTKPGEWTLRFECEDKDDKKFYRVRAPIGANVKMSEALRLVVQNSLHGVPDEITAGAYSELTKKRLQPKYVTRILSDLKVATYSKTLAEAACKAIVLHSVDWAVDAEQRLPLNEPQLAVLAAKGAGYRYSRMTFLSSVPGTLTVYNTMANYALGAPEYASQPHTMALAFACGEFVVGKPYDPALLAADMPPVVGLPQA